MGDTGGGRGADNRIVNGPASTPYDGGLEGSPMRVLTLNCNGIRSAAKKGLFDWLPGQRADFVCLQETKAQEHQLGHDDFRPAGYHCHYFDAEKKGYAGVAVYSRAKPDRVIRGFGVAEFDREGRYLEVQAGKLSIISLYLPSGSSGPERQASKFRFLEAFLPHLDALRRRRRDYVLCGDWNIAHKPIDLKNWKSNQKNSGFLPEERAWLDLLFDQRGWVDAFREVSDAPDQYTWWSNRGQAWAKNVGWRIDYQLASPGLRGSARRASIYKARRFSDHAPLIMDYDL
jgi:exodeoxyribonuclease III